MSPTHTLTDQAARDRVDTDTRATLFVEAGAGTGKTYHLVRRLSRLVVEDGVPIDEIAAITFTEKAAAELRDRLRVRLVAEAADGDDRAAQALAGLDTAAIGTLHSFALRLLAENPLEAGIPPRVTTQHDTAEDAALEALWDDCTDLLFGPGREAHDGGITARAVDEMLDAGVGTTTFREVVEALHADWDRLPTTPLFTGTLPGAPDVTDAVSAVGSILAWRDACQDETDKFYLHLESVERWRDDLVAAVDPDTAADASAPTWTQLLGNPPGPSRYGRGASWGDKATLDGVKTEAKALPALCDEILATFWRPRIAVVLDALAPVVLRHAADRRRRGTLQFHDQLVLARELLGNAEVRERVRARYTRVLLDEFQDTDPIQLDLAELITVVAADEGPEPGRLFTVGDPKQSIYRFRRADIATYLRAQTGPGVEVERLSTNFRCTRGVLDWVNRVFAAVLVPCEGVQPEYRPLEPAPGRPTHDPTHGPAPFVFRSDEVPPHCPAEANDDHRRHWSEAADVARVIATALREGWTHESKDGTYSPLRLGDIAILLPSRGSLPMIETCLDHAGIDYRAEASSIVYGTPEIRDLLLAVRAAATTADEASIVGALRSPLFGCGDDDLLRWRAAGGTWAPGAPAPEGLDDSPVAEGMRYLADLSRGSRRPGELLARLVEDRLVLESVAESPRRRDLWRRIRFVIEHAWQWEESADDPARADLRDYADWALSLTAEDARVPEAAIPEIGVDAVRITTIHASKGLEYPMVVLAGMSRRWPADRSRLLWTDPADGGPAVPAASFGGKLRDPAFDAAAELEKQHSLAERIRLLYVATTRAESRLAVSGYGHALTKDKKKPLSLWGSLLGTVSAQPDAPPLLPYGETLLGAAGAPVVEAPDAETWAAQTREVAARSAERAGWSATRIVHPEAAAAPATDPAPSDATPDAAPPLPARLAAALRERFAPAPASEAELPPPPRTAPVAAGPDVGTAVHHLAEVTDLARSLDADWETWAAGQLAALGLGGGGRPRGVEAVAEMVGVARTALASEPVRRAGTLPHWSELPLAGTLSTADGETVAVDGVADLVVDEPDGTLSIIDYKTDVGVTTTTVDEYLLQLCAYAELLHASTGRRVSRIALVFCRGSRATVIARDLTVRPTGV
ncbi:UvrD-helicase domain-containing protein [Dietzia sp. 179-F 9C3 NHS]|uniref:UvrD-helicase domain-containing protein n=1 Tax=Dietzia sp. 179-F 9C3 NHS TaxID=3374295 RepID=UPI0038799856